MIDRMLGTEVETFYTLSRRKDPRDAVCDLRSREGTTFQKIGFTEIGDTRQEQSRDTAVTRIIKDWAIQRSIQVIVWTDLESNFQKKKSIEFSSEAALDHLKDLSPDGIREAVTYIVRTTQQVNTRFRQWLKNVDWFNEQVTMLEGNP